MNTKPKIMVWDWPIRVFHWLFAATILLALGIALLGEHASFFQWHMLFGLCAGFLLLIRIVLGFFFVKPYSFLLMFRTMRSLPHYLGSVFQKKLIHFVGHNPLAWLVYALMFLLLLLTIVTGVNMDREWAEEIHSVFAWSLLVTIVLHLLGIGIHTYFFRENVALSMLHGRRVAGQSETGGRASPVMGGIVLALSIAFMGLLFSNYQPGANSVRLPWFGNEIFLGEDEREHEDGHDSQKKDKREREHDEKHEHGDSGHDD